MEGTTSRKKQERVGTLVAKPPIKTTTGSSQSQTPHGLFTREEFRRLIDKTEDDFADDFNGLYHRRRDA